MPPLWGIAVRGLVLLALLWGFQGHGNTIEQMESVLQQYENFNAFLADPAGVAAYRKAALSYYGPGVFNCQSFEQTVAELRQLNHAIPAAGESLWATVMLDRSFPVTAQNQATYEFRALPRNLHGIWLTPAQWGCSKNFCAGKEIERPQRWALALQGALAFALERGGSFQDSAIWVLPLKKNFTQYSLASAVGGPNLKRKGSFTAKDVPHAASLWEAWVKIASNQVSWFKGDIVTINHQTVRTGTLSVVTLGNKSLGPLREFEPTDPLAQRLSQLFPHPCFKKNASVALSPLNLFAALGTANSGATAASATPRKKSVLNPTSPPNVAEILSQTQPGKEYEVLMEYLPKFKKPLQDGMSSAFLSPDKRLREKAAIAAGDLGRLVQPRSPASEGNSAIAPPTKDTFSKNPFSQSLNKALTDPNPFVRDAAAVGLANQGHGNRVPNLDDKLSDALQRPDPNGESALSSPERSARAAEGKRNAGLNLSPQDMTALMDQLNLPLQDDMRDALIEDIIAGVMDQDPSQLGQYYNPDICRRNPNYSRLCDRLEDPNRCPACDRARRAGQIEIPSSTTQPDATPPDSTGDAQ